MSGLDWGLVIVLNGSIVAYGFYLSRGVVASTDWFLAGRRLPWWLVGFSLYATAIDSSDLEGCRCPLPQSHRVSTSAD